METETNSLTIKLLRRLYVQVVSELFLLTNTSDSLKALSHFEQVQNELEIESQNTAFLGWELVKSLKRQGLTYRNIGIFDKSESQFELAWKIVNELDKIFPGANQCLIAEIFGELAICYRISKQYEKAETLLKKSLELVELIENDRAKAHVYFWLGNLFLETKKLDQAKYYIERALILNQKTKDIGELAMNYHCMGTCNLIEQKAEVALSWFKKAMAIELELNRKNRIAPTYFNLASSYFELQDYPSALHYLELSLLAYEELGNEHYQQRVKESILEVKSKLNKE